jgi:hypothetical protein
VLQYEEIIGHDDDDDDDKGRIQTRELQVGFLLSQEFLGNAFVVYQIHSLVD